MGFLGSHILFQRQLLDTWTEFGELLKNGQTAGLVEKRMDTFGHALTGEIDLGHKHR